MAAKKKKVIESVIDPEVIFQTDTILVALKERYFRLYKREMSTGAKNITKLLDDLEVTIEKRKKELVDGNTST